MTLAFASRTSASRSAPTKKRVCAAISSTLTSGPEDIIEPLEISGEDRLPGRFVGRGDIQVFFKPARSKKGRVEQVGPVGRADDEYFF